MKLYAIADLHLSFGTDKPMNIFKGWENHAERVKQNWNALITAEDLVIVAGDVSWGLNLEQVREDFLFLEALNGSKIIIKGNHDYWWATYAKLNEFLKENGFNSIKILHNNAFLFNNSVICGSRGWFNEDAEAFDKKMVLREAGRLEASIKYGLKLIAELGDLKASEKPELITFLHYPPIYARDENSYIVEVLKKYEIKKCFYGHIHSSGAGKAFIGERDGISYRMITADFLNFTPILIK